MAASPFLFLIVGGIGVVVILILILVFLARAPSGKRNPIALILAVVIAIASAGLIVFEGPRILQRMQLDPNAVINEPLRNPQLRNSLQFQKTVTVAGKNVEQDYVTIIATLTIYGIGGYGVLEIGDVRLAFRGREVTGSSTGNMTVGSNIPARLHSSSGTHSSSVEDLSFRCSWKDGVTQCSFADTEFEIRDCTLRIGERAIPIGEGKKVLLFEGGETRYFEDPQ